MESKQARATIIAGVLALVGTIIGIFFGQSIYKVNVIIDGVEVKIKPVVLVEKFEQVNSEYIALLAQQQTTAAPDIPAAATPTAQQQEEAERQSAVDFYQYFLNEPAFAYIREWIEAGDSPGKYRGAQLILAQDFSPLLGWTMHTPEVPAGRPGDNFAEAGTVVSVYIPDGEKPFNVP